MQEKTSQKIFISTMVGAFVLQQIVFWTSVLWFGGRPNYEFWDSAHKFTLDYTVQLQKQPNKDFVVLNLADVHIYDGRDFAVTKNQITDLINYRRPDLITLSGDNCRGNAGETYREFFRFINGFGIKFAPIFGNHDGEGVFYDSKNKQGDFFMTLENCVFKKGPSNFGIGRGQPVGNYIITVMENDTLVKSIFMMDSNQYLYAWDDQYDYIHKSQIEWYEWGVRGINALPQANGKNIESMVFFHIPLPQIQDVYDLYTATGDESMIYDTSDLTPRVYKGERVWSSKTESGMYDKIKELNSTKFIFNGNDHLNNFSLTDPNGITFTYCLTTGNLGGTIPNRSGGTFVTVGGADNTVTIEHTAIPFRT